MKSDIQKTNGENRVAQSGDMEQLVLVSPLAHVVQREDAYELKVDLPGVSSEALHIDMEQRTLSIEAESLRPRHEGYRLVREEFPAAHYRAHYEVPEQVDAAAIKANLVQGVLTLTLPKSEEVKPRRIAVNVK